MTLHPLSFKRHVIMRVTPAEQEIVLAHRAAQPQRPKTAPIVNVALPAKSTVHARTEWCPNCNPPEKLLRRDLDQVHAEKGCFRCKRKFKFVRTDTPEGKRERTKQWRLQRISFAAGNVGMHNPDVTREQA